MSTDTTTIVNNNNETTTRRPDPSVNVYLRIRPFIGDELSRGENQQMLAIRDEKRIAVKLYPTATNNIRPAQTSYNEYEVTRIFDHRCTQQELFEQILEQPTDEIFTGSNWLLCTLGLTNSGKTHTMFGTPKDPGLIPQCLQRIFLQIGYNIDTKVLYKPDGLENLVQTNVNNLQEEINARKYIFKDDKDDLRRIRLQTIVQEQPSILDDHSFEDEHYSIWISFFELYNENIFDLLIKPNAIKKRKPLRFMQNNDSTMIKDLVQIPVFDLKEAEDTIRFGFANRATSKTDLNDASSRSHAVLCLTLITFDEFEEEPTMSHMYICDLAGNEPSTGTGKQLAETCNINTSLMTFKDCVRVLNENQTAKKQMLLPYRNSVLTSIFRPFFIGRGRILICCNVNPCASFISQTNDLLKFSALAQKTIIVPIEPAQKKVVIESKIKGPKRLGRGIGGAGKKKHHQTTDSDDVDEESSTDPAGACTFAIPTGPDGVWLVPTDVQSIYYWKYCTKKAVDLLQKQATHRRAFLIEQHEERAKTVHYLLYQREQIDKTTVENDSLKQELESLRQNLTIERENHQRTKQQSDEFEMKLHDMSNKLLQTNRDHEAVRLQLKHLQQKFDSLNNKHNSSIEQYRQREHDQQERGNHLEDEIQRLKRDFELESYRKNEAEKKVRLFEEKIKIEQIQNQKCQQELKAINGKYDALQVEMLALRETKTNELHPPRVLRPKRSAHDEEEQDLKKAKPGTPDRSIGNVALPAKPGSKKIPVRSHTEDERKPTPPTTARDIKTKSASILKKKPSASANSVESPLITGKSVVDPHSSPVDLQPPPLASPSVQSIMSPKPSTLQRIQSFFRHTPPSGAASNRIINQLKANSTGTTFGSSSPLPASPIAVAHKPVALRKQTPKRRYRLRNRVNSNQSAHNDSRL